MISDIETYYRQLAPKLTNYLVAGGTPYGIACEIVQETFLRVWQKRSEIVDCMPQVSGLVYTIARNLRNDRFRHDRFTVYTDTLNECEPDTTPEGTSPADTAYLRRRLLAALRDIPQPLREAYLLFQVSELSIREIARQVNISESLVKVRIFRAKEKLKAALSDLRDW